MQQMTINQRNTNVKKLYENEGKWTGTEETGEREEQKKQEEHRRATKKRTERADKPNPLSGKPP